MISEGEYQVLRIGRTSYGAQELEEQEQVMESEEKETGEPPEVRRTLVTWLQHLKVLGWEFVLSNQNLG